MTDRKKPLRIFFLEDNRDDVELELYELRKAGYDVEYEAAMNRTQFLARIQAFKPDIVLADYSLPDITGTEAIRICSEFKVGAPVILITGEGNEQIAVDSLRVGAIDYIIKRNISGLPARISRALEIWSDRKARERAEAEEKRLHYMLFENQKMESIGRLAGGIAHDFNNLLTGVIGYAELCMRDVPQDSQTHERLKSIVSVSRRGADLVRQLLIFSKKVPLEFKAVDINAFLLETFRFLRRIVEETVEIRLALGQDVIGVRCDPGHFTRVLMNLALNARDAMQGKGVLTIAAEKRQPGDAASRPSPSANGEYVCVSVSDTGCGIKSEHLGAIFDPFFTTKEPGKGTGLGLAIVQSVVQSHDGVIEVSSNQESGTVFRVYLPLAPLPQASQPVQVDDADAARDDASAHATVLIAEDEDMLRELITTTVSSLGYHVLAARNGSEALALYRSQKIDLIISDMLMPGMGGMELFREVRAINPRIKFILVTGYSLGGQDREALSQMNAVLMKPYSSQGISDSIRSVLTA